MDYEFQQLQNNTSGRDYDGIRVSKSYIIISQQCYQRLKDFESLGFFYDKKNNVIALKNEKDGSFKLRKNNHKSFMVACRIYKEMPMGRYNFLEEKDGMLIFQYQNNIRV